MALKEPVGCLNILSEMLSSEASGNLQSKRMHRALAAGSWKPALGYAGTRQQERDVRSTP